MSNEHVERRLAAILAADVVDSCRLIGIDEEGTLAQLKALRKTLFDPKITDHRGRIVKNTGDGALVEFASVVDAVRCAVEVQCGLAERNTGVPQDKRIVFRVGINVGDIIIDGNDIFGDGVNIAVRLETLCEPGGLCISGAVRDQVQDKLPLTFADLGEKTVKNIARPVHAFGLSSEAVAAAPDMSIGRSARPAERNRLAVVAAATMLIAMALGATAWWAMRPVASPPTQASGSASTSTAVLTRRASVAVLPLVSLADSTNDDYFADGLTEDIISALGRFADISVRSRNAVFTYKGKTPRPDEIGRELDVRYIVEGSIRRAADRIRVSIRLTDTARGALLWSEQYNAEPKDIFSVQDDITLHVTGAIAVKLTKLEQARSAAKPPNNLEAYDLVLRGRQMTTRRTRSANVEARRLFQRAIDIDAGYAAAYVGLADTYFRSFLIGWTDQPVETLKRTQNLATTAISLDGSGSAAHALLGMAYLQFRQYEQAIDELKRAIEINPSDAESYGWLGNVLLFFGTLQDSIKALETALLFDPNLDVSQLWGLGTAYFLAGRTADATRTMEQIVARDPGFTHAYAILAAAYSEAGRPEDAARVAASVRKLDPFFDTSSFGSLFRNPDHQGKIASALRKAGL